MRNVFVIILLIVLPSTFFAQNVGINTATPHSSAGLDVTASDKGILIPRVSLTGTTDLATIASPATSLLVYNTASVADVKPGFYYYNGTVWVLLLNNATGWTVEGNSGTVSGTNFIGTTDAQAVDFRTNNVIKARLTTKGQLEFLNTGRSVFVGEGAGASDDLTDNWNVFVGYNTGMANTSGGYNTAIGYSSFEKNIDGDYNTAVGLLSLAENIDGDYNVATGYRALFSNTDGDNNTALGVNSLYANRTGSRNVGVGGATLVYNQVGNDNVAIGNSSLFENVANNNTAVGSAVLYRNDTGNDNSGVGYRSLWSNTLGAGNSSVGANSLYSNTIGVNNSAIGFYALHSNTEGHYNTASGAYALEKNTTDIFNTATGAFALRNNNGGASNTAMGVYTLHGNTVGNNNTALGYFAFYNGTAYSNSTALGRSAAISASDQIRLGNAAVGTIGGFAIWSNVSDARFKTNVTENVLGLDFINELRPVTYNLDMDAIASFYKTPDSIRLVEAEARKGKVVQTGFIAQEVEAAAQELGYDFSGVDAPKNENDHYSLRYAAFTVPLVKAVQELSEENEKLKAENESIKNRQEAMEAELTSIKALLRAK